MQTVLRKSLIAASITLPMLFAAQAAAQSASGGLSVEELQAKLAESEQALADDVANREETLAKVRKINEQLAEREKRRLEIEQEFTALCEEQEKLKPGSMDDCMAKLGG